MALATAICVLTIELWVRAAWDPRKGNPGFFLSDPIRVQRLAPNYSGWFAGVPVHINSLGLRDERDYELEKGPKTFRILVLGDSVTFGHGSITEHTYPRLLERRLKAWRPDVDWQVWNAAVPGYNTSQELAQLLDVGPTFQPDLVVIGFFENDLMDNRVVSAPARVSVGWNELLSFVRRHIYSFELYKRIYLELGWRLSRSDAYRKRLEHLGTESLLLTSVEHVNDLAEQQFTPFEQLTDEQLRTMECTQGEQPNPAIIEAMQREPGWPAWLAAVRRLQELHHKGIYRIVFFLNLVPPVCPNGDVFYDGGSERINEFFVRIFSDGTPVASTYEAFRHRRPSQMPNARAHPLGNANLTKAEVLFTFLRDELFPRLAAPGSLVTGRPSP